MPNHRAEAIANEFIRLNEPFPMSSQMWLQKLVYISQGWNLAINREPLIEEEVQAWDGGPVFRSIWENIRDYGVDRKTYLLINPKTKRPFITETSEKEESVISHVWNKYHEYSGRDLSVMTHKPGTPWTKIYLGKGRNETIPKSLIRSHYVDLALAGRARG